MSWCSTWKRSSAGWPASNSWARRGRPARRRASWSCSAATMRRSSSSIDRVAAAFGFAEVYPVSGQTYSRKIDAQVLADPGGHRGKRPPLRHRPAAAGARARGGRAVRGRADRLVGDGLQAQPDAGRADVLAGAVRAGARTGREPDRGDPVARAHARRQRDPPPGDSAGVSWRSTRF